MGNCRGIVVGDYKETPYHPLQGVEGELQAILGAGAQLEFTGDYGNFNAGNLSQYDFCVSYIDKWGEGLPKEQVSGLLSFVAQGGGLLILHNGIAIQSSPELAQLAGARFTGHPEYAKLQFTNASPDHAIMAGIEGFALEDEPYRFEFCPLAKRDVLITYEHEGESWEGGWAHEWGLGRVVYLMPGHTAESFKNPVYRELVSRSRKWVTKAL